MNKETIKIEGDHIKLDQLLKLTGLASSGGHAKDIILNGHVKVNHEVCLMRGKKLRSKDIIEFETNMVEVI